MSQPLAYAEPATHASDRRARRRLSPWAIAGLLSTLFTCPLLIVYAIRHDVPPIATGSPNAVFFSLLIIPVGIATSLTIAGGTHIARSRGEWSGGWMVAIATILLLFWWIMVGLFYLSTLLFGTD